MQTTPLPPDLAAALARRLREVAGANAALLAGLEEAVRRHQRAVPQLDAAAWPVLVVPALRPGRRR